MVDCVRLFLFLKYRFFFVIRYLILSFMQEGFLSSHEIILFGIKLWKMFSMFRLNEITCSLIYFSQNRSIKLINCIINKISLTLSIIPEFTSIRLRILNVWVIRLLAPGSHIWPLAPGSQSP